MSILFELGDGQGACLCVEWKYVIAGRWVHYWFSPSWQAHKFNIGRLVITWRLRPYRKEPQA